jgi:hypothetical protein
LKLRKVSICLSQQYLKSIPDPASTAIAIHKHVYNDGTLNVSTPTNPSTRIAIHPNAAVYNPVIALAASVNGNELPSLSGLLEHAHFLNSTS